MDWRVFLATAGAIFLAEMADKTQLVSIAMASKTGKPFAVLIGSACGYVCVTALSILVGMLLAKYVRPDVVRYFGGGVFVFIGILMLLDKL